MISYTASNIFRFSSSFSTLILSATLAASALSSFSSLHAFSIFGSDEKDEKAEISKDVDQSKVIKLTLPFDPGAVDPRKIRDLSQVAVSRCIFGGLMRTDRNNRAIPDIAERVETPDNGQTYICTIHPDAKWSDGQAITAYDVRASWLSTLNPREGSPNASMLFVISNGHKFFKGEVDERDVGIDVLDSKTLRVKLETRCPFFPQLLTTYPFFILPKSWIERERDLSTVITMKGAEDAPSYGPYIIEKWDTNRSLTLKKNPHYRFASKVLFDTVVFEIVNEQTALVMFEKGEVDLAGSPLSTLPIDAIPDLKERKVLGKAPAFTTTFLRVNTRQKALEEPDVRRALSNAIDRAALVNHVIQGAGVESVQLVPPLFFSTFTMNRPQGHDAPKPISARTIRLSFPSNDRDSRIAQTIQQNIQTAFPEIKIQLDPSDAKHLYAKIKQGNYDLALGSWVGDYLDPDSFYEVFQSRDSGTNNTGWQSTEYKNWFLRSREAMDLPQRQKAFAEMEDILQKECPVIPLFHNVYMFAQSEKAKKIYISPMGTFDFLSE